MSIVPISGTMDSGVAAPDLYNQTQISESLLNLSIPYVDAHYGYADGIIDPKEYALSYIDPISGVTVYLEQNSTVLFVGLEAETEGWIGFGWKNYTDNFQTDGLNNSDMIYGYTPGTYYDNVERAELSDVVTVHYILSLRNGTVVQEGDVPQPSETAPLSENSLLQGYKDEIVGMRIGEIRHFIIPAAEAYNDPAHLFYGYDLEYVITLTRINSNYINPGDRSNIEFSDEHGISTFQHQPDANQSRILDAGGQDDGEITRLEYFIQMNSTDPEDIPLLNATDISYPFMLMYGDTEDIYDLPIQHSEWATPPKMTLVPNEGPELIINSPEDGSTHGYVAHLSINATDDSFVRTTHYRMDDENWTEIYYDFQTDLWEVSIDLTEYDPGAHSIWVNATDPSNVTTTEIIDITIERPYSPLLGMKLDATRTYSTKLYHTAEVRDDFTVTNNGSAPINALEFFYPVEFADRMLDITATDGNGFDLQVVQLEDYQGLNHWRVYLFDSVDFQEIYTFSIIAHFHSLHTMTNFDLNEYEISFPKFPSVPYVLRNADTTITFRSGDTLSGSTPNPSGSWSNLAPMQDEVMVFKMNSFTPYIVADRTTDITMDPWGWLLYSETIFMENLGNTKENLFSFTLPEYTTTVTIYDDVGILAETQPDGTWELNETVDLTINLLRDRFGDDGLWPGYKYTFHIDYKIQIAGYYDEIEEGARIELPMGLLGDVPIREHEVNLILPYSVSAIDVSGEYRLLHGVFDSTIQYKIYNTTQYNAPQITLVYATSVSTYARPILFSIVIGLIAGIYVLFRRVEFEEGSDVARDGDRAIDTRQAGAPVEVLSEFAKTYSRKTALSMDLEKLEASRRKGKVRKKEFMIRERDLKSQIQEIDSALPALKEELMQFGARYRDLISQLELQNEKVEGAKAGLKQLLIRKKKQRISRAAFEKSRQDYLKTIKRATTATDRILMTIQEEAGEI
jgi:hypothetical protein